MSKDDDLTLISLRHGSLAPKQNKQSTKKRENQKYRRKIRIKRELSKRRIYEERRGEELRWGMDAQGQFDQEVRLAKAQFAKFMERTGIVIDLDGVHGRIRRRGQKVCLVMEEMFPMLGRSWLNLKPGRGRRAALNGTQLRQLGSKLVIPKWREMTTNEQRAVLMLLAWKDRIDPEEFRWNKGDFD